MLTKTIKVFSVMVILLVVAFPTTKAQSAPASEIQPFPGAPLCPTHNDREWHSLWDATRGCHYDHTHNDDYRQGLTVFEDWTQWIGQISYPNATLNENSSMGHTGYKHYINLNPVPIKSHEGFTYINPKPNYVTAFWIELHDVGGNMHFAKPIHSFYMAVRIEGLDGRVGYMYTGGWAYFGCAMNPYKAGDLPLPGFDPVDANGNRKCWDAEQYPFGTDPYRAASPASDLRFLNAANGWPDNKWIWTSFPRGDYFGVQGDYNNRGFFFYRTLDSFTVLDNNDPMREIFACSNPNAQGCKYNNSEFHVFTVGGFVPSSLDTDGDGLITYSGYTDRRGNIVSGCTSFSLDCIPVKFVNAPVGMALWARNTSGPRPEGEIIRDHDTYFNGQPSGWIQFPGLPIYSPTSMPPMTDMPPSTSMPPTSDPLVTTEVDPPNLDIGGTASVRVSLHNVPVEGYKSAEFTCSYGAGLVEKSNIVATNLFGTDPAVAIFDPQNGSFIVAIAGTNSNRAITGGPAFTFDVKGLQAGQSAIQCTARISKGDNIPMDLPSTGTNLSIGPVPLPTSIESPALTPTGFPESTTTSLPAESSPTSAPSPNGSLSGQVIASKAVTVNLIDANNVPITSVIANPDGTFSLTALSGSYTLLATASGFLSDRGSVTITDGGNNTVLPTINLVAGDVDGNNVIDQFDALTIGMSYKSSTPTAADLNNDVVIDFLDLELLAENYRKTGPSVWQ